MTSSYSVTGRSSLSWLRVQVLIGWRKVRSHGKHHVSFRMRNHLRSGLQSPCHPCPRGRKQTVKRLSCGPTVVELTLPILAHEPDTTLHLHCWSLLPGAGHPALGMRSRDGAPLLLELAGPVRHLADAPVQAALPQRPAEESPVTASLSSLTACRTRRSNCLSRCLSNRSWMDMLPALAGVLH